MNALRIVALIAAFILGVAAIFRGERNKRDRYRQDSTEREEDSEETKAKVEKVVDETFNAMEKGREKLETAFVDIKGKIRNTKDSQTGQEFLYSLLELGL